MQNLADEFGVSWDTIQRDITMLEQDYPLIISRGHGGGVALPDRYYLSKRYLTSQQVAVIRRAMTAASSSDSEILQSILTDFAWSD